MKKSSFQYGMTFSIENVFFILGPSLAVEKQGLGLTFSIENEIFKPRMQISSENENSVRGLQRGRGVTERGGNGSENFSALLSTFLAIFNNKSYSKNL